MAHEFYRGARALITGASGFIGAHLAASLQAAGAEVHGTSREAQQRPGLRWHQVGPGDALGALVRELRPDVVFHLAARMDRGRRSELLAPMLLDNTVAVASLCDALLAAQGGRLVLLGTAEEYGAEPGPWVEGQREAPASPYGLSKAAATMVAELAHRTFGLRVVVGRPSVLYGPGQRGDQFIPSLIATCMAGERFAMTRGEQSRDFIFIDDLIDGMLRLGACDHHGRVFHLCAGVSVTVASVALRVQQMIGRGSVDLGALPYRQVEAMVQEMSPALARDVLGWQARVSLDEGLRRTIEAARAASASGR